MCGSVPSGVCGGREVWVAFRLAWNVTVSSASRQMASTSEDAGRAVLAVGAHRDQRVVIAADKAHQHRV